MRAAAAQSFRIEGIEMSIIGFVTIRRRGGGARRRRCLRHRTRDDAVLVVFRSTG